MSILIASIGNVEKYRL